MFSDIKWHNSVSLTNIKKHYNFRISTSRKVIITGNMDRKLSIINCSWRSMSLYQI